MQPCVLAYVCSSTCLEMSHTQVCKTCVTKPAYDLHALSMQKCSNALPFTINPSHWNLPNNSVDAIITKFDHFLTINHLLLCIWANLLCIDDTGTTIVMGQIYLVHIKQLKRGIWKLVWLSWCLVIMNLLKLICTGRLVDCCLISIAGKQRRSIDEKRLLNIWKLVLDQQQKQQQLNLM